MEAVTVASRRSRSANAARAGVTVGTLLIVLFAVAAWLPYRSFSMDDSYITYRYAKNLTSGKGFTFNDGERVQGTTTPLFTFILALSLLVFDDPRATGAVLSLLGFAAAGLLVLRLFGRLGHPLVGTVLGLLLVTSRLTLNSVTMETGLYVFWVLLFLVLKYEGHDLAASVVAPLAFLTRFDGILLYPMACIRASGDRAPRIHWPGAVVVSLPTVAWLLFAKFYFGSFLPNTFHAKAHAASLSLAENGFLRGVHFWVDRLALDHNTSLFALWVGLALVGLFIELCLRRWRAFATFWSLAYLAGYTVINPPYEFPWYQVPTLTALLVLQGFALQPLLGMLRRGARAKRMIAHSILGLWLATSLYVCGRSLQQGYRDGSRPLASHLQAYSEMASYLRQNAAPTARVAAAEIGIVGYESGLEVIDLAGLVSPRNRALIRARGWSQAVATVLMEEDPEYMVLNVDGGWSRQIRSRPAFMSRYREVLSGKKGRRRLVLFERTDLAR